MGLKYTSKDYYWCLTYEQPLEKKNTQNRKYRVLLASKELMEYALKKEPFEVFNKKGNARGYTHYCDRRWFHLRTMGQIVKAKKLTGLTKGQKKWLDTFFIGELSVIVPDPDSKLTQAAGRLTTMLKKLNGNQLFEYM